MRNFLGLAGYYQRFVDGFSNIAASMTTLTLKNVKFEWTNACGQIFQELKKRLATAPILTIPKGEDGFVIYCDVSGQELGAGLMQDGRVIAYASCQLKDYDT